MACGCCEKESNELLVCEGAKVGSFLLIRGQRRSRNHSSHALGKALARLYAGRTKPLFLEHGDDVVANGRTVAVLMVGGAAGVTKDDAVVAWVGFAVAGLALGRQHRLGRLAPLGAVGRLGDGWYEDDGLVDAAPRLGARG